MRKWLKTIHLAIYTLYKYLAKRNLKIRAFFVMIEITGKSFTRLKIFIVNHNSA